VGFGPLAISSDPAVHTTYVTTGTDSVSMINTGTCNIHHLTGCAHAPSPGHRGHRP
jgi:hypothetical protein